MHCLLGFRERYAEAMDDDFNTANGMAVIFDLVKAGNEMLGEKPGGVVLKKAVDILVELTGVLGLLQGRKRARESLEESVEKMIAERQAARKAKEYHRADEIRNELSRQGILLEDTPEGVKWKRMTI